MPMGVSDTMVSDPTLKSAGIFVSGVRAPPSATWPDGGPQSLRSSCCELAMHKNVPTHTHNALHQEQSRPYIWLHKARSEFWTHFCFLQFLLLHKIKGEQLQKQTRLYYRVYDSQRSVQQQSANIELDAPRLEITRYPICPLETIA
ncbi:hypothetical protein PoB_004437900 [Plakobranchus ocellatus]|uniref:Uncharacterized protein n=1 Tax=Plakobranchus ocellatus TaxID=259542 RepID=A0AAV4BG87_9GAST|nr:hypothetical protein PoB_004437900 [Plakobranchus ocellatus]